MDIDPRKRKYQVVPSPWYVHPFEVTERGVPALLPLYERGASEASRAEFFADVLFALYGDYFRHGPRIEGRRLVWYCPAADQKDNVIEGELDANNAVEWVEVPDAANTMSDYLSSGDFYRVCADTARDLELNAAGMAPDHAQVELRRARLEAVERHRARPEHVGQRPRPISQARPRLVGHDRRQRMTQ